MQRIYLDHHATTPVDPAVVEAMAPYWTRAFGNASSAHLYGWEAMEAVERAQEQVATLIGCRTKEVIFTSGATEADNLALRGVAERYVERGRHFVSTTIEHPAVLDTLHDLQRHGAEYTLVEVDASGVVDPGAVIAALRPDTVLCSVMWANNEIGTIQPIPEIAAACRERGVIFHSDAVQAVGHLELDATSLDLLSLTAHKFYGPKGVGALMVRRGNPRVHLEPLFHGGGQQKGLRPGTLPVPLIVGLGAACELAMGRLAENAKHVASLRDHLLTRLQDEIDDLSLNGDRDRRLPGNANLCIPGVEAEALLLELREVAASAGSACSASDHLPSHVLRAIGLSNEDAHASIRFGVGKDNTRAEIDEVCDRVVESVRKLRSFSRPPASSN
jgi:cysteine desulfurase